MDDITTVKLVTLILMLISSFFATLIPSVLKKISSISFGKKKSATASSTRRPTLTTVVEWFLHVSQGFAAGVLLAGGLAHLLSEYTEELAEALDEVEWLDDKWKEFPWGATFFIFALTFLYLLEKVSHEVLAFLISKRSTKKHNHAKSKAQNDPSNVDGTTKHMRATDVISHNGATPPASSAENQPLLKNANNNNTTYYALGSNSVNVTESDSEDAPTWIVHEKNLDEDDIDAHDHDGAVHAHMPKDLSQLENQSLIKTVVSCFVLWVSLVSHSYIEGLGLGLQKDAHHFMSLLIAIMSHKLFAAYSLGVVLSNTLAHSRSVFTYFILAFLIVTFSVVTPAGIATGILLSDANFSEELWFKITSSVLMCCAGGAFVYIGVFELLVESNNNHGKFGNRLITSVAFHATFLFGLIGMIVLALWA